MGMNSQIDQKDKLLYSSILCAKGSRLAQARLFSILLLKKKKMTF